MRPLAKAVVRSGLVSKAALDELQRWGLPVEVEEVDPIEDIEEVVAVLREALEGSEQVRIQESDLDVLRQFLDPRQQRQGRLALQSESGSKTSFSIQYCTTKMGEYVLPWKSESIRDIILFGGAVLTRDTGAAVALMDVRESYLGQQRAFMICTPETPNGD